MQDEALHCRSDGRWVSVAQPRGTAESLNPPIHVVSVVWSWRISASASDKGNDGCIKDRAGSSG